MTLAPRIDTIESKAKRNYIINGNFDFWQRSTGVSAAITSGGSYICDRFTFRKSTGSGSVFRQFKNGSDNTDGYVTQAFSATADGAAGFMQMGTQIEKKMMRNIIGKEVTLHFQARGLNTNSASLTNSIIIFFRNDTADGDVKWGANQTSSLSQSVTLAGTSFETVSYTFTIPADTEAMFIQFGGDGTETYGIKMV